jgi:hypothetical protein
MEDPVQVALRMLPIFLLALARLASCLDRPPTPPLPFQLPPRRRIRRNRVEFRPSGAQQAAHPDVPSSHPMWDRWLDT